MTEMTLTKKWLNKEVLVILLLCWATSCGVVPSGLRSGLKLPSARHPAYQQASPFYSIPSKGSGDIEFFADYAGSWKDTLYYVEMFYSVKLSELIFLKSNGNLISEFTTRLECYDEKDELLFYKEWDEAITADDYESTRAERAIVKSSVFQLEPGRYGFVSVFEDKNSNLVSRVERDHVVIDPAKDNTPMISDIGFTDYRNHLFQTEQLVSLEGDYRELDHVNRTFTDSLDVYYEIFNVGGPAAIEYSLFDTYGEQVLPDSLRSDSAEGAKMVHFDISTLEDGLYTLAIKVAAGNLTTGIEKQLTIRRTGFDLKDNFEETIRLIDHYINVERTSLDSLKNSEAGQERLDAWFDFWKRFDPTPHTNKNEYLDKFVSRTYYVNRNFGSQILEGSYTDMGQVYICLGPPDDAYYTYMSAWSKAYEVWEYFETFTYTQARTFLFYDENGTGIKGDYRLVNGMDMPQWFEY